MCCPNLSLITSNKTLGDVSEIALLRKINATGFEVKLNVDEKILQGLIWVLDSQADWITISVERAEDFLGHGT